MKPSPVLCGRLKTRLAFTTKEVGKGFYRGTGTGSMGAHTAKGEYLIDYRKVRHFVVPDLEMKRVEKLTPFIDESFYRTKTDKNVDYDGESYELKYDGLQYLKWYKSRNPSWFDEDVQNDKIARESSSEGDMSMERDPIFQESNTSLFMGTEEQASSSGSSTTSNQPR